MSTESFLLFAFVIPSLCTILALLFGLRYSLSRVEAKLNALTFELGTLNDAKTPHAAKTEEHHPAAQNRVRP